MSKATQVDKRLKPGSDKWIEKYGNKTLEQVEASLARQVNLESTGKEASIDIVGRTGANKENAHLPSVRNEVASKP